MPNPGIWNEAALDSRALEPVGLFDWGPERLVKGSQLENFAVSREIPEHRNLPAIEIDWRSENLAEERLNFLAMFSQDWALQCKANRPGDNGRVFREPGGELGEPAFGDEHIVVDDDNDLAARNPQSGIPRGVCAQGAILTQATHRPTSLGKELIDHAASFVAGTIVHDDYFGRGDASRSRRKRSQASRQNRRAISRGNDNRDGIAHARHRRRPRAWRIGFVASSAGYHVMFARRTKARRKGASR
jgi:hypothetical protein